MNQQPIWRLIDEVLNAQSLVWPRNHNIIVVIIMRYEKLCRMTAKEFMSLLAAVNATSQSQSQHNRDLTTEIFLVASG